MYTCFTGQLEPQAFFGEYNISSLPCVVKMICAGIEEDLGPLRKDEQAQMCTKCMCVCAHGRADFSSQGCLDHKLCFALGEHTLVGLRERQELPASTWKIRHFPIASCYQQFQAMPWFLSLKHTESDPHCMISCIIICTCTPPSRACSV